MHVPFLLLQVAEYQEVYAQRGVQILVAQQSK